MADRVAELGPVEGVEMKVADAAGVELTAQFGGDGRGDQLPSGGQIVEPFEEMAEPGGNVGPAIGGHALDPGEIGDGHDAGHDLDVQASGRNLVLEAKEAIRSEEELRDRAIGAGVDLALEIVEVGPAIGRVRSEEHTSELQ